MDLDVYLWCCQVYSINEKTYQQDIASMLSTSRAMKGYELIIHQYKSLRLRLI